MAVLYSILVHGLKTGPSQKQASNGESISGVFVHKHGTRSKARGYMKYFMFPGGFVAAPLFMCLVDDPPARRTCPPDQCGVQMTAVHFHLVAFEDIAPGDLWIYGPWSSSLEAHPWPETL